MLLPVAFFDDLNLKYFCIFSCKMVDKKVLDLLKVLKGVSRYEITNKLHQIRGNDDNHKCHLFLEDYFKRKDAFISPDVYNCEAQCITNIFPQYTVEYVQSMLETLGSEDNRVVIVLRQLLKSELINNNRPISNELKYVENNVLPECLDTLPRASSSNDLSKYLKATDDGKYQLSNTFKRKSDTNAESAKTKIKSLASLHNSTFFEDLDNFLSSKEFKATVVNDQPIVTFPNEEPSQTEVNASTINTYLDNYLPLEENECQSTVTKDEPVITFPNEVSEAEVIASTSTYLDNYLSFEKSECESTVRNDGPIMPFSNEQPSQAKVITLRRTAYFDNCIPFEKNECDSTGRNNKPNMIFTNQESSQAREIGIRRRSYMEKYLHDCESRVRQDVYTFQSGEPSQTQVIATTSKALYPDRQPPQREINASTSDTFYNNVPYSPGKLHRTPAAAVCQTLLDTLPKQVNHPFAFTNNTSMPGTTMEEFLLGKGGPLNDISPPLLSNHRPDKKMLDICSTISSDDETESNSSLELIRESSNTDYLNDVTPSYDIKLVSKIMEMFPDASPVYIKQLCFGKVASPSDCDTIVQIILSNENYPKRGDREPSPDPNLDVENQVALLQEILPDADPNYLQYKAELYLHDKRKLKEFISDAVESKAYPTMKEYLRKKQLSAQVKQYTTEFNIDKFLELIPNPDAYFGDSNRKSSFYIDKKEDVFSVHYARIFLKNRYPTIAVKTINSLLDKYDCLTRTAQELDRLVESKECLIKTKRKPVPIDSSTLQNMPLLQEIAYLSHRDEIKSYLDEKEAKEKKEKEIAKQNGMLETCNCCYSDEVMPKSIVKCESGCSFCSDCVKSSVQIRFSEGKLDFPCLLDCGAAFGLQILKEVLVPKMFSKVAQRKQLEEVKAAGINELEMCPFCDFATIPAPEDKLFKCLNPECMKESCRQCKEPSHIPYRCDEIEKDDDVKKRTYIENKMTEALVRVCYNCSMKFIKADGCNKMTCSCGAAMCYVCGKPVTDYKHFNGQGGDQHHLCPLYSDTQKLHQEAVIKGAEQAKVEIGVADDPKKLKIDPTADLYQHYKCRKHDQHTHQPRPPHMNGAFGGLQQFWNGRDFGDRIGPPVDRPRAVGDHPRHHRGHRHHHRHHYRYE